MIFHCGKLTANGPLKITIISHSFIYLDFCKASKDSVNDRPLLAKVIENGTASIVISWVEWFLIG